MPMKVQVEHQELLVQRHDSAAHLLAEAMQELFPGVQFVNKHANVEGFISEIALEHALSPADLVALEQYIAHLSTRNWPCKRVYWSHLQALAYFRQHGQAYQIARLEQASDEGAASQRTYAANYPQLCTALPDAAWPADVLIYQHGAFAELCAGPHVEYAGEIGVCRLVRVEAVRDAEGLQRVYGVVELPKRSE